jgi:parallel beta-helix repeat protein
MHRLLPFISSLLMAISVIQPKETTGQSCCPEFILKDAVEICPPFGSCKSDPVGQHGGLAACHNSTHTYTVYPNDPSFTYTWTVTGGTPINFTGNPNNILWGNGASGFIKVVISSNNPNLICVDSILMEICLIDGPQAGFTLSPDTVCQNTPVNFNNTSLGGSTFNWNFGDGSTYTGPTPPPHSYSAPGTYTVILTVQDMGAGQYIGGTNGETKIPCGCIDTATAVVVVLPGVGPEIETDCCYGTVCPGDTSSFCTPMVCANYQWIVTGGTIIPPANASCIKVKWNNTYSVPTTVTLKSCPTGTCPGETTINVPVLYPDLPISGPTNLCLGASGSFSLPHMPGTFYLWTVTGGSYAFNDKNKNISLVNISFNSFGTFWVKCVYNNPLAGCNGVDSIQVDVTPKFEVLGPDKVCEGDTAIFFTNSLVGGPPATWTFSPAGPAIITGQGTPTVSVSSAPGNYTIIATSLTPPLNCNLVATKNYQVVAKPVLGNITGTAMVCPNTNYSYAITSNTSGSPFTWSIGPGTGVILSQMGDDNDSVIVKFSGSGPWTLNVYQEIDLGNNDFCKSLTKTLVVNPFPQPTISGNHTVCVDAVENYIASGPTPPGGFQWSISPSMNGTILNGQGSNSVNIKWHGPATTAVITVSTCSGQDTAHVVISIPPTVFVTPSQTPIFCIGTNTTLTLTTLFNGSYSYQWYDNNGAIGGQTTNQLNLNIASFANPGIYPYYVVVTNGGCTVTSNIIYVIIETCTGGGPTGCPPNPIPDCPTACFNASVVCGQVFLTNSSYINPTAPLTYLWSVNPNTGTFSPNNTAQNPTLTVTSSGVYTITLIATSSASGCSDTASQAVTIFLPSANFTVTSPVCENSFATFTAIPNLAGLNYFWTFGDGSTSYTAVTQHAYASAALSPYTVSLTISDNNGCTATYSAPVTVNPTPVCTITASDTAFCPGSFVTLTACSGMSSYQWYYKGTPIPLATNQTHNANQVGEYWVQVTNSAGCTDISNKLFIYMYQRPKAKITGEAYFCEIPGATVGIPLSTIFNANYSYNWYSIPAGATFSPSNQNSTWVTLTLPFVLPVYYQFVVDVTNNVNGCVNSDTLCVLFNPTPSLSIVSIPALDICEGTPVTLIPNLNNTSLYNYLWSNGATIPVITVSTPGFYSLTITDKATGCSSTAFAGSINPKPDLSLFPIGCDSLCDPDSLHLYIPLPLNWQPPFNTYPNAYPSITWLDYGSPVGNGPTLTFPAGTSGNHQFSVAVTNHFGCSDTAGVFCLSSSCCDIILENLAVHPATCPESADGWFTIVLDPASSGGPFTITSVPVVPPFPTTITPGIPLSVYNLPSGTYSIIISGPNEGCMETFQVLIDHLQDECCFAEIDSLFTKILINTTYTTDVVWDGKYYIDDNVIVTVTNGAVLDITTVDCVFGECAGIVFINGAMLRSSNSVYRPCYVDQTWKGLRFVGKGNFDNIINECTFKNAEVALYLQQNADAVISSNLFSNCNYGVRVETNNTFNHPISGNRFVTEQFFPVYDCPTKYSFINNSSTYGIYSTSSRFRQQVSQNEFVNTWGTGAPRTHGIYQINGGGTFSNNTFTDLSYSIYLNSSLFTTIIENNEIEVNEPVNTTLAPIFVATTNSPVIEINNNEISDNLHQFSCFSAIYIRTSSKVSIMNNKIDGFQYGIYVLTSKNIQVSSNKITEADVAGIYFTGKGNYSNYITCNEVKMRSFNLTRGLFTNDLSQLTEISSNCFNDSYTSMDIRTIGTGTLPKIRNNFMYNYNFVGINVVGYSGNIGTLSPPDPGLNTLWSNYNPAIDINSNTNITVADNFGMFNISWPTVQITSNRPFHSTASCAQQIFNMPSQGNLNVNYVCDNYSKLFTVLAGSGGQFSLPADYKEQVKSSSDQFSDADLILASIEPADSELLEDLLNTATLSSNEIALLKYKYYYRIADIGNARLYISQFMPSGEHEIEYKALRLIDLDILEYGWDVLSDDDFSVLEMISEKNSENADFAISLLNNSPSYKDHIFDIATLPDVVAGTDIKHIDLSDNYLKIRPNPATDKVYIDILDLSLQEYKVQVHDISGKLVTNYKLSYVAGGLELDISNLNEGFYMISMTDTASGTIKSGKLIKIAQSRP